MRWGRLTLRERIGEGAYAEVYRAVELGSSREVALKLFWPSTRSSDALLQRALQEARSLSSVKHPGVAAVHYVESNNERLGMCCEFVRGQTLAHLLHLQGRFSAWEACVVGIQLCGALAAVHDAGFLHRDVKTFNVMREEGGRIVLMDFGAAQAIDRVSHHAAGTPLYLAPEVADGRTATIRSDLYSVGVLLFNLVTDSYPYPGLSLDEVVANQQRPVFVKDVRKELPSPFADVVQHSISISPAQRFANATEMQAALREVLSGIPHYKADTAPTESISAPQPRLERVNVFISYCHEDRREIDRLKLLPYLRDLESPQCAVWSDHDLKTGDEWDRVINDQLKRSQILVPLVTQAYLRSKVLPRSRGSAFRPRTLGVRCDRLTPLSWHLANGSGSAGCEHDCFSREQERY